MNPDSSLQLIFDRLLELNVIRPSRVGPIRTAIKQYAQILGYSDAAACPSSAFLKPDKLRNRLIDEKAPTSLGINGVRNLKNNVSFLLRKAISVEIISPFAELASWKECNPTQRPKRNEARFSPKYVLDPVPHPLEQEFVEYKRWSTKIVNRARPKRLRKRTVSFLHHRDTLLRVAGYLVKFKDLKPESITLLTLIESQNAIDYLEWYIEQQGKHTSGSVTVLSRIISLAKYLEIIIQDPNQTSRIQHWLLEIGKFRSSLPAPVKVEAKDKRWLSIDQLEMVGRSIYPFNARRVQELRPQSRRSIERCLKNGHEAHRTFRGYAYNVMQSLLIRLTVRIPLRQRNLREMHWSPNSLEEGQNLYKKSGVWHIRFRGEELKIAHVRGEEHLVEFEFPADLVNLLEEWLYKWRPLFLAVQKPENQRKQRVTGGQQLVFLNSRGRPLKLNDVTHAFERATHKFTGVAVNPHMFRTIFATEYIKETNNFIDAAHMLSDSVKTVIDRYAKLLDEDCAKRASKWISRKLDEGGKGGDEDKSPLPKLRYPRGR
jgi:hypothetical protein